MEFSEDYPQKAPTVKFVSSIFHPNGTTAYMFFIWRPRDDSMLTTHESSDRIEAKSTCIRLTLACVVQCTQMAAFV